LVLVTKGGEIAEKREQTPSVLGDRPTNKHPGKTPTEGEKRQKQKRGLVEPPKNEKETAHEVGGRQKCPKPGRRGGGWGACREPQEKEKHKPLPGGELEKKKRKGAKNQGGVKKGLFKKKKKKEFCVNRG